VVEVDVSHLALVLLHRGLCGPRYTTLILSYLALYRPLSALGHSQITCAPIEYVTVKPPPAQTCQQYLSKFISTAGGYVTNPSATDNCQFCSYRTTDELLQLNSNIFWSHRWRNVGFLWMYIVLNVRPHSQHHVQLVAHIQRVDIRYLCYDLHLPYSRSSQLFLS
jgi:hypothetical protein